VRPTPSLQQCSARVRVPNLRPRLLGSGGIRTFYGQGALCSLSRRRLLPQHFSPPRPRCVSPSCPFSLSVSLCLSLFLCVSSPTTHPLSSAHTKKQTNKQTDCVRAMGKAVSLGHFTYRTFDPAKFKSMAQLENGDVSWIVPGKFIAFSGPLSKRRTLGQGLYSLLPAEYVPLFKQLGVSCVVRFNNKCYDKAVFERGGIKHVDLFYEDGGNPTEAILQAFLKLCETEPGAIAVHCKAGLGRTGTNIVAYMVKHYGYTVREAVAWHRICRPGAVVGPQQQFLLSLEQRLQLEGDQYRLVLLAALPLSLSFSPPIPPLTLLRPPPLSLPPLQGTNAAAAPCPLLLRLFFLLLFLLLFLWASGPIPPPNWPWQQRRKRRQRRRRCFASAWSWVASRAARDGAGQPRRPSPRKHPELAHGRSLPLFRQFCLSLCLDAALWPSPCCCLCCRRCCRLVPSRGAGVGTGR